MSLMATKIDSAADLRNTYYEAWKSSKAKIGKKTNEARLDDEDKLEKVKKNLDSVKIVSEWRKKKKKEDNLKSEIEERKRRELFFAENARKQSRRFLAEQAFESWKKSKKESSSNSKIDQDMK
ncbi:MAG: hypothetical protein MHPSP_004767, partial [Paramarteilia canceri]